MQQFERMVPELAAKSLTMRCHSPLGSVKKSNLLYDSQEREATRYPLRECAGVAEQIADQAQGSRLVKGRKKGKEGNRGAMRKPELTRLLPGKNEWCRSCKSRRVA